MRAEVGDRHNTLVAMWRRDCKGTGVEESRPVRGYTEPAKGLAFSLCLDSHPGSSSFELCDLKEADSSVRSLTDMSYKFRTKNQYNALCFFLKKKTFFKEWCRLQNFSVPLHRPTISPIWAETVTMAKSITPPAMPFSLLTLCINFSVSSFLEICLGVKASHTWQQKEGKKMEIKQIHIQRVI